LIPDIPELLAIVLVLILAAGIIGWYLWSIGWALFKKPMTGSEALIGKSGVAVSDLQPDIVGEVNVEGIIWKAKVFRDAGSNGSRILVGESVIVVGFSGLIVTVKKEIS
jgi:membrane-bound ClpP family serine protease